MSVATVLSTVEGDLSSFWSKLKNDVTKAKAVWAIISSPQTRAAMISAFNQVVLTVEAAGTAVQAGGVNVTLDAVLVTDVQQLIVDVKAGDGVLVSDFKAIGIVLKGS